MKTNKIITYKELKDWCELHNVSDDTPIAIYDGDSEYGSGVLGLVIETPYTFLDEEELEPEKATETSGKSCYCCNTIYADLLSECNSEKVLVLTNGVHFE